MLCVALNMPDVSADTRARRTARTHRKDFGGAHDNPSAERSRGRAAGVGGAPDTDRSGRAEVAALKSTRTSIGRPGTENVSASTIPSNSWRDESAKWLLAASTSS